MPTLKELAQSAYETADKLPDPIKRTQIGGREEELGSSIEADMTEIQNCTHKTPHANLRKLHASVFRSCTKLYELRETAETTTDTQSINDTLSALRPIYELNEAKFCHYASHNEENIESTSNTGGFELRIRAPAFGTPIVTREQHSEQENEQDTPAAGAGAGPRKVGLHIKVPEQRSPDSYGPSTCPFDDIRNHQVRNITPMLDNRSISPVSSPETAPAVAPGPCREATLWSPETFPRRAQSRADLNCNRTASPVCG